MDLIEFNGVKYPQFQTEGNMTQYSLPFATKFCKGRGYDIGCNRKEWALPWAIPVDLMIDDNDYEALKLPEQCVDFIYSSHCLEHIPNWVEAIEYWTYRLKTGGVLFLYLPDYSQEYWRPWNCRKHKNVMNPDILKSLMIDLGYKNIFISGVDLNNSFMIVGEKHV